MSSCLIVISFIRGTSPVFIQLHNWPWLFNFALRKLYNFIEKVDGYFRAQKNLFLNLPNINMIGIIFVCLSSSLQNNFHKRSLLDFRLLLSSCFISFWFFDCLKSLLDSSRDLKKVCIQLKFMQNIQNFCEIREKNPRKAIERSSAALSEKTPRALASTINSCVCVVGGARNL